MATIMSVFILIVAVQSDVVPFKDLTHLGNSDKVSVVTVVKIIILRKTNARKRVRIIRNFIKIFISFFYNEYK